jgi:hypothetical protein
MGSMMARPAKGTSLYQTASISTYDMDTERTVLAVHIPKKPNNTETDSSLMREDMTPCRFKVFGIITLSTVPSLTFVLHDIENPLLIPTQCLPIAHWAIMHLHAINSLA